MKRSGKIMLKRKDSGAYCRKKNLKKTHQRPCKKLLYKNVGFLDVDILQQEELRKIRKRKNKFLSSYLRQ
jgi:hypothetical protein